MSQMVRHLIRVEGLRKAFQVNVKGYGKRYIRAVDSITFSIRKGESLGLIGESGCGKTTLANLMLRLLDPDAGSVHLAEIDICNLSKAELREKRRLMQIVFQNPYDSLDPRMTVYDLVSEPLIIHDIKEAVEKKVHEALDEAGLSPPHIYYNAYPHNLSGGQRQRVALARAIVFNPSFLVLDEPVSMLDVSTRGEILKTLLQLKEAHDMTYLFITHDLATARHFCDRIAIMYLGRIVEIGMTDEILKKPLHPYTQALIAAVPKLEPGYRPHIPIVGEITRTVIHSVGCRFSGRCPYAAEVCGSEKAEELLDAGREHFVACTRFNQLDESAVSAPSID